MDLVLMGGNVLTQDSRSSRAEALAVRDGKIAAVGSNAELAALVSESTKLVHLAGRTGSLDLSTPTTTSASIPWSLLRSTVACLPTIP